MKNNIVFTGIHSHDGKEYSWQGTLEHLKVFLNAQQKGSNTCAVVRTKYGTKIVNITRVEVSEKDYKENVISVFEALPWQVIPNYTTPRKVVEWERGIKGKLPKEFSINEMVKEVEYLCRAYLIPIKSQKGLTFIDENDEVYAEYDESNREIELKGRLKW